MTKKTKRNKKKRTLYHYLERRKEAYRNNKITSLIDIDEEYLTSVKSLVIKKETKGNLTTAFLNGKMLMFSKTIQSFVYNLIDVFLSPDDVDKEIYKKNDIQKCFLLQNLTETDSTSPFLYLFANFRVLLMKQLPETLFLKY